MDPEFDLALLLHLWRVADRSRAHVEFVMADLIETTCAQLVVMQTIAAAGGVCRPSTVAEALTCSRSNVSQVLRGLRQGGRIEARVDERDARCRSLALTPRGRDALSTCEKQLPTEAESVFEPLHDYEKVLLHDMLKRLPKKGL